MELRALRYKWNKIASILGISRTTLYRRLFEAGVSPDDHTQLSESTLDEIVRSIKVDHPNDGEILMQGHLRRLNINIKRQDLRASIHRVDAANIQARRANVVRRRVYLADHPNSVWHLDGNHKLIRWRFVTHGAIDGYSRTITFLRCSDNNRATTVLDGYKGGVAIYGLPCSVRTDYGGENVDVWRFMVAAHDNDISSVITGSSTHNERIERLWRDVFRCVAGIYYQLFKELEESRVLDPLNEIDLYCLHYVYLPRINLSLTEFKDSWNEHAVSTEGNMTPHQLFFEGINIVTNHAGGDNNIDLSSVSAEVASMASDRVEVSRNLFRPCHALLVQLSGINIMLRCTDNGKRFYMQIIDIVGNHIQSGCTDCLLN